MLIVFQHRIPLTLDNQAESLESVHTFRLIYPLHKLSGYPDHLSPYKLSGYRPTISFIDASTQDILRHKTQTP